MKSILNPRWLFIINTLPIVLFFFLCFSQYNIIKSLLKESNINLWKTYGFFLGILGLSNFVYAIYLTIQKKHVSFIYGIVALVCYIPFIYLFYFQSENIIPFNIPRWMLEGDFHLYLGTFLMPTLVYALFIIVVHFTSETKEYNPFINFLIAIFIPISVYVLGQIILPLWQKVDDKYAMHILLIGVIVATLLFFFFLTRSIFLFLYNRTSDWQEYQIIFKLLIAMILPLLGLLINNGVISILGSTELDKGIFGNFTNNWYYALAILNGVLICLPNLLNLRYRFILFLARTITFTYTLYFFVVFLPYLPLAVVAIVAIGAGFLMLTPFLLFIIHVNDLRIDYNYLTTKYSRISVIVTAIFGILIIPTCITITYLNDRSVLNQTLDYIYCPNYDNKYTIDKTSLQNTLTVLENHKSRINEFILTDQTPYLSSYFNWLVLDNMTLSDLKINKIENIFFGKIPFKLKTEINENNEVEISNIKTNSTYDEKQSVWKSNIEFELTNKSKTSGFTEFSTSFELPEGCWISDYYLYINDKKENGILAEKRSAKWVYSNIKNVNNDPGILSYLTGNKVSFQVFPFAKNEVRKTGIEFLHKDPVSIIINKNKIELGDHETKLSENIETENVIYISAKQKKLLKPIRRTPYFHFLVDISNGKKGKTSDFANNIETVLASNKKLAQNAKISFVNSYVTTIALEKDWEKKYLAQTFEGGFFLERAINSSILNSYKTQYYPVIVVVTDSLKNAVLDNNFLDIKFAFPEIDKFFILGDNGKLVTHSLVEKPLQQLSENYTTSFDQEVLSYQLPDKSRVYLPNDSEPSIILKHSFFEVDEKEISVKHWNTALEMQGIWRSQVLHPEKTSVEGKWKNLLKYSFISKIMTPLTSYIVVENEAQKAILVKKQNQVLSANKSLDLDDDIQRMSEPNEWIIYILLIIFLWYFDFRKR